MSKYEPTHEELVQRAAKWLRGSKRCVGVVTEVVTACHEVPDAIGWIPHKSSSILIECKASRSDFHSDQRKFFRKHPENGIGQYRYYMTAPRLVEKDEVPKCWGLLWAYANRVVEVKRSTPYQPTDAGWRYEMKYLLSLVRRAEQAYPEILHEAAAATTVKRRNKNGDSPLVYGRGRQRRRRVR